MSRWKASGLHLLICVFIAIAVTAVMLLVWYPQPYFDALGGKRLLIILLSVDVVLGPLITLIIYNEKKKRLKFDLMVIAFLQLAALFYGASVLFQARPVFLVFTVDRFEVVTAIELSDIASIKGVKQEYQTLSLTGPKTVTAKKPTDPEEQQRILSSALDGGPDLQAMPQHYVAYEQTKHAVLSRIKLIDDIPKTRDQFKKAIIQKGEKFGYDVSQFGYLPVAAGNLFITALMNLETAEIIELVVLDPWG